MRTIPLLLASTTTALATDFAILRAIQPGDEALRNSGGGQGFAASAPGVVDCSAGEKYANAVVRLEAWDGPAPHPHGFEDVDELPWLTVEGARTLWVSGFDPPNGEPLDLGELGAGRVRVCARGRHRYFSDDIRPDLPPEEWLLQLWPADGPADAFAGGPRRRTQSWADQLASWRWSGWSAMLRAFHAHNRIAAALKRLPEPFTMADIEADWAASAARCGLPPTRWTDELFQPWEGAKQERLAWLARFAGRCGIELVAIRDLWQLMERAGLLYELGDGRYRLATVTESLFDGIAVEPLRSELRAAWAATLVYDEEFHQGDITHLVRWFGDEVESTPKIIADRYGVVVDVVLHVLATAEWVPWEMQVDGDLNADSPIRLVPKTYRPRDAQPAQP